MMYGDLADRDLVSRDWMLASHAENNGWSAGETQDLMWEV